MEERREKGRGEKIKLLSSHVAEGGNSMLTKFDMKIYITPQESRRGGNKWGEGNVRREGKWEKGDTRNKHFLKGTRSIVGEK